MRQGDAETSVSFMLCVYVCACVLVCVHDAEAGWRPKVSVSGRLSALAFKSGSPSLA